MITTTIVIEKKSFFFQDNGSFTAGSVSTSCDYYGLYYYVNIRIWDEVNKKMHTTKKQKRVGINFHLPSLHISLNFAQGKGQKQDKTIIS